VLLKGIDPLILLIDNKETFTFINFSLSLILYDYLEKNIKHVDMELVLNS
jgi:hypothetical protein